MKISAVILTKNEEKNIKDCLQTLSFADEIIVIDDDSNDKTRQIAKKLGAKVFERRLDNDFSSQRNFGLNKAKGEWILFVDADERISSALRAEILNFQFSIFNGAYLRRKDYFLGRWLNFGETAHVKLLRLAKKDAGQWKRKVHETWVIEKGRVGELKSPLLHYPHATVSEFLKQINEYADFNARQFFDEGKRFQLWEMLLLPTAKFFFNYFIRFGFLDGFPGFVLAIMMAWHSLISRVKLWEIQSKKGYQ